MLVCTNLGEILLAHHMFTRLDVFGVLGDEDALALTTTLWLADVRLVLLGPAECLVITVAIGKKTTVFNIMPYYHLTFLAYCSMKSGNGFFFLNPLKTSPKYALAGVYGKCVL